MSGKLSQKQYRFLAYASMVSGDMWRAASDLGTTLAGLSNTRNRCLRLGYIKQWEHWPDVPELTPAGREALKAAQ